MIYFGKVTIKTKKYKIDKKIKLHMEKKIEKSLEVKKAKKSLQTEISSLYQGIFKIENYNKKKSTDSFRSNIWVKRPKILYFK